MATQGEGLSSGLGDCGPLITPAITAALLHKLYTTLQNPRPDAMIRFDNINPETANAIFSAIGKDSRFNETTHKWTYNSLEHEFRVHIMPSHTHDIGMTWFNGEINRMGYYRFLNLGELDILTIAAGTRFQNFTGVYTQSTKEPDFYVRPRGVQDLPSIALESAWTERRSDLDNDKDLWLIGGQPHVRLVFIFDFKRTSLNANTIKGLVEVWHLVGGQPVMQQQEVIFPAPVTTAQHITIARGDILGSFLAENRPGNATFNLSIDRLREIAREHLGLEGLVPA